MFSGIVCYKNSSKFAFKILYCLDVIRREILVMRGCKKVYSQFFFQLLNFFQFLSGQVCIHHGHQGCI